MKDKIVFLLNSPYPYYTGGRETWLNNVANRMVEEYDVVIITEEHAKKANSADRWTMDPRITIKQVKGLVSFKCIQWLYRSYLVYFDCYLKAWTMQKELIRQLKSKQKTFVISMDTVFVPRAFSGLKGKFPNMYTIISSRGPHAEIYGTYWKWAKKHILNTEKKNLQEADLIWSNGYDTQQLLKSKGFNSNVVLNGVDCKKISTQDLPPHVEISKATGVKIVTIGTLLDLKGYPTMISSLEEIKQIDPNLTVDLFAFGKGNPEHYISMAASLGVEDRVHFLGEDKNAALYAKQADILLALGTSAGSGMSMAALEMMATGVPIIATDIYCYQQLITDCENGFLVPENDEQALAQKIVSLAAMKKEDLRRIGSLAQNIAHQNDWSVVADSVSQEFAML